MARREPPKHAFKVKVSIPTSRSLPTSGGSHGHASFEPPWNDMFGYRSKAKTIYIYFTWNAVASPPQKKEKASPLHFDHLARRP